LLPPEKVKKCLSRMSWKLSRTVLRRGKGSNPFFLVDYTSPIFQKLVKKFKLRQSMSRRGNCWDTAAQESFLGHFKAEAYIKSCETLEDLKKEIKQYMLYYNKYRYQWNLKKMTPVQYRNHLLNSA
ncbi:IS3 family transposase, partial [Clostridium sporogenes]|uniref:IS3 family transposase n=1 Tax=Clostridium sporogenes TaxID=1509 RepID=UPI003F90F93F